MAFINVKLDDTVKEGEIVPEGRYGLQIFKVERAASKKAKERGQGENMTVCHIRIQDKDYPNAFPIRHFLLDVGEDDEPDIKRMRLLELKRFLTAFGVPYTAAGYDPEDLQGAQADCNVVQEEGDDKVMRNRLQLPRLKE